jgi:hypothetical protein
MKTLKRDVPSRSVGDVGPGDYVKIGSQWQQIASNSAQGTTQATLPKHGWEVRTTDGRSHSMYGINRYAKAEDLEDR